MSQKIKIIFANSIPAQKKEACITFQKRPGSLAVFKIKCLRAGCQQILKAYKRVYRFSYVEPKFTVAFVS